MSVDWPLVLRCYFIVIFLVKWLFACSRFEWLPKIAFGYLRIRRRSVNSYNRWCESTAIADVRRHLIEVCAARADSSEPWIFHSRGLRRSNGFAYIFILFCWGPFAFTLVLWTLLKQPRFTLRTFPTFLH